MGEGIGLAGGIRDDKTVWHLWGMRKEEAMAGKRQPIELVIANGKKHLTNAEIEERRGSEVKAPSAEKVTVPGWVPKSVRKVYRKYAKQLSELEIFAEIDRDELGRYVIAQAGYEKASGALLTAIGNGAIEAADEWAAIQDKMYKQAEKSAAALGLNITSRCRLVVPKTDTGTDDDPLAELARKFGEG